MPKKLYTVTCNRSYRGTAGAAKNIKPLRAAIEAIGGEYIDYFIGGPWLYARASLTPDQADTVRSWYWMIQAVDLQAVQPGA